jgi:hypothetical protein
MAGGQSVDGKSVDRMPIDCINPNAAQQTVQPGATTTFSLSDILQYVPGDTAGIVGAVLRINQNPD